MFDSFFNSIFGSMISWNAPLSLLIISFILTSIITIVYKYVTDQKMLKELKDEMKRLQEDIKNFKDNPTKVMETQKVLMEKNMKMMMHTLKPTLFTFVPLLIIFGWMTVTFVYEPLAPNVEFPVQLSFKDVAENTVVSLTSESLNIEDSNQTIKEGKALWYIQGEEGNHKLIFEYNNKQYSKDIQITPKWEPSKAETIKESDLQKIEVGNRFRPFFGLTWLWTYIISSIVFSLSLRKLLKIH